MTLDPDEILARIDGTAPLVRLPVAAEKPFVDLREGDCREVLKELDDNSVDSVVTDPPYALTENKKGGTGPKSVNLNSPAGRARITVGFMGKAWDNGDTAFDPAFWQEVLRVLKPGGHVLAFGGTRTYHKLASAIDDGGFEMRDAIMWHYASGFPKSSNQEGDWEGWGTALKPATEIIAMARKPLIGTVPANLAKYGTGALNIDGCRVEFDGEADRQSAFPGGRTTSHGAGSLAGPGNAQEVNRDEFAAERNQLGRWPANVILDGSDEVTSTFPQAKGQIAKAATGGDRRKDQNVYGAMTRGSNGAEPRDEGGSAARFFYCAKSSKADRNEGLDSAAIVSISVAWENADREVTLQVAMGTSRPKVTAVSGASTSSASEWSMLLFGSPPTGQYQTALKSITETKIRSTIASTIFASFLTFGTSESIPAAISTLTGLSGSPAESAEHTGLSLTITSEKMASALGANRAALPMRLKLSVSVAAVSSTHPTVKPTPLMQYLTRLVTPSGGIVLDPFMGSGSTGRGAVLEGFSFIGIEMDAAYYDIADARIAAAERKVGR